jgi:hypothetical protein
LWRDKKKQVKLSKLFGKRKGVAKVQKPVATAVLAALLVLLGATAASAVPAYPGLVELEQPDGKKFLVQQWGDERLHGWETVDGYTIVRDKNGYWYFARKRGDGSLASSGIRADRLDLLPKGYPKHLRPGNTEPQAQPPGERVTLVGVVVFSRIGSPHYELLVRDEVCTLDGPVPPRCFRTWKPYVLLLENAKPRVGWLYLVRGHLLEGPNAWERPAVQAGVAVPLLPAFWTKTFWTKQQ